MARKTKEEALRTKQKLLDSALEVMSERSYSSISMTEIAERIGYSKGAIYWHFRNKNDILVSLVNNTCLMTQDELTQLMIEQHNLEGLRAYLKRKISIPKINDKFKMLQKLMQHRQEWPEDVRKKVTDILVMRIDKERGAIEKILRQRQLDGKIKQDIDTKDVSVLISAIFHGIFLFQVEDVFYRTDFSEHVDTLLNALEKELSA